MGRTVRLIDRRARGMARAFLGAVVFAPRVLVNGLTAFERWDILLACWLRRDIVLYLHDTDFMLDAFERDFPLKARLLARILRRNPVLCVSEAMAGLYAKRFGAQRVGVVYETVPPIRAISFEEGFRHIVMVGTPNQRKGVQLFSDVADLAIKAGLNWRFHWLGGPADPDLTYSTNVVWHGWIGEPRRYVEHADCFFLSSVDDPFPLSALEALSAMRRVVVYRETGIAEIVADVRGCGVFDQYDAAIALAALKRAMSSEPDTKAMEQLEREIFSPEAFRMRMERELDRLL